jgi:type IV secretory pathway VirB2 component (pilin)
MPRTTPNPTRLVLFTSLASVMWVATAQAAGGGLPFDALLVSLAASVEGPLGAVILISAIVGGGAVFMFGGRPLLAIGLIMGGAIVGAARIVSTTLLGHGGGLLIPLIQG